MDIEKEKKALESELIQAQRQFEIWRENVQRLVGAIALCNKLLEQPQKEKKKATPKAKKSSGGTTKKE